MAVAIRLAAWLRAAYPINTLNVYYGYFDPPWTPAFLRRNEAMLRIEAAEFSAFQGNRKP